MENKRFTANKSDDKAPDRTVSGSVGQSTAQTVVQTMGKTIDETAVGLTASGESNDLFPSVKRTRTYAVLKSEKDFTFHIWTRPSSFYHAHDNYIEIFIVTEGKIVHHFNKQQTVLKTGDAFIVKLGQYHKHSQYQNYSSQHINLTCNVDFANDLLKLFFGSENVSCQNQLIHLNSSYFETVLNYQKLILEAQNEEHRNLSIKSLLAFVFGVFYAKEENDKAPDWLKAFMRKLANLDFGNEIRLADVYKLSNYSQTTICREFKKCTGKTLISYINDLRLNYACNLLESTTFPLWKISNVVGFLSQAHFTRLFKEKYGITPLQYRKK